MFETWEGFSNFSKKPVLENRPRITYTKYQPLPATIYKLLQAPTKTKKILVEPVWRLVATRIFLFPIFLLKLPFYVFKTCGRVRGYFTWTCCSSLSVKTRRNEIVPFVCSDGPSFCWMVSNATLHSLEACW
jgi:hypothetical protein